MKYLATVHYTSEAALTDDLRGALDTHKVVHVRGVPDGVDPERLYFRLASAVGHFLFKNENPVTAELDSEGWLDMRYDAALAEQHAYRHGNGRMGLHMDGVYTDVDFDLIFLWCERPADFGGASTFIDGDEVIALMRRADPALLDDVLATPVLFQKGVKSKWSPIIYFDRGLPSFNWNQTRVAPSNSPRALDVAERFHRFCEARIVDGGLLTPLRLERGEAVFFHNRLVLHGRNSFFGDRCLMKGAIALTTISPAAKGVTP